MNKKLIALAVAGMFAAPAVALAAAHTGGGSSVTIYGTLNAGFGQFSATGASTVQSSTLPAGGVGIGANQPNRNGVTNSNSNIGFKGSEDLGGGLKAGFQIETTAALDGGGAALGNRNTGINLSGAFGTVLLGQWDTPYKVSSYPVSGFYSGSAASYNAIIGSPGFGVASSSYAGPSATATSAALNPPAVSGIAGGAVADAAFDRRQGNSLQYWSPNFSGFDVKLLYSANETKSDLLGIDPRIYGVTATYSNGPFYVAYGYERHNDFFGTRAMDTSALPGVPGSSSQDTGNKLNAAYKFGNTQVGLIYERLQYNRSGPVAAVLSNYKRNAYMLSLTHNVGAGKIMANYGSARDGSCQRLDAVACNASGTGAKMYAIGYDHAMSKRTNLFATYVRVENKTDARYTFGNQQTSGVGVPAAGADPKALFAGMRHTF